MKHPVSSQFVRIAAGLACATGAAHAADGLRVVTWNITHYAGDRYAEIGTVVYGEYNGKSMNPDVFCLQEMTSRSASSAFALALNSAPGSPGDWVAAPAFTNSSNSLNTAIVYRSSKLTLDGFVVVSQGAPPPAHPRNVIRYDFRPVGYPEDASIISFFPLHFRAGTGPDIEVQREDEAGIVVAHVQTLPPDRHVILAADLNIRSNAEFAYQILNGLQPNTGTMLDPISRVGPWHANTVYQNIHTQDPSLSNGGMDDRYDQILLSGSLLDKRGMDYDGAFPTPWNLGTTEDPSHSYRAWGNDGTTFNAPLRTTNNAMVGTDIATAIVAMADPNGHIPVFLDLDMPPRIGVEPEQFDLGDLPFDQTALAAFTVRNAGDTQRWGPDGIADLRYSFVLPSGVVGAIGPFTAAAGLAGRTHVFQVSDASDGPPGERVVDLEIVSDDPASPTTPIQIRYRLVGCSLADFAAPLGVLNFFDLSAFVDRYLAGDPSADLAEPAGVFNFFDIAAYIASYQSGCP